MLEGTTLTAIDGVLIIIVLLSAILAMAQGLTREVLSILSASGSFIAATYLAQPLAPVLSSMFDLKPFLEYINIPESLMAAILTGGILFLFIWVIFSILTHRMATWVENSAIGGVDRFLGFVFGIVRGLVGLGILYILYSYTTPRANYPYMLAQAKTLPLLDSTAKILSDVSALILPDEFSQPLQKHLYQHQTGRLPDYPVLPTAVPQEKVDIIKQIIEAQKQKEAQQNNNLLPAGVSMGQLPQMDTKTLEAILTSIEQQKSFGKIVSQPATNEPQTRP